MRITTLILALPFERHLDLRVW